MIIKRGISLLLFIFCFLPLCATDYVPTFGDRIFTPEDTRQGLKNLPSSTSEIMAAAFELQRIQFSLGQHSRQRELADLEIINNGSGTAEQDMAIIVARIGGGFAAPVSWVVILLIVLFVWGRKALRARRQKLSED